MMSLATLLGFLFGYPINSWMIKKGLKHGMMSRPQGDESHHHHHMGATLPRRTALFHTAWTYAVLICAIWIVS